MKTFGQVLPSSPKIPGSFYFSSLSSDEGKIREMFGLGGQGAQPLSLPASQSPSLYLTTLLCWTDFLLLKGNGESPSSHAAVSHEMATVRCD